MIARKERAYEDAPKVDQNKQDEIHDAMKGEEEDKQVVWDGLEVSVNGMEGM